MTRGRAAAPDPFDIGAVNRSGELYDALAARRFTDPGDDPAARLLAALVADVDVGAPPLPVPARISRSRSGSRRRVVRTVVTLGVTAAVLTSAGAAAAGGGGGGGKGATGVRPPHATISERTDGSLQVSPSERALGRGLASPESRRRRGDEPRRSHRSDDDSRHWSHRDQDSDPPESTPERSAPDDHPRDAIRPTPSPSTTIPSGRP